MIAAYFDLKARFSMLLSSPVSLLMVSILILTREIQLADMALDVHLSDPV